MCHTVFLDRPISKVVLLVKYVKISEIYGAASTHALGDRQQSNRSRTTDSNLDQPAQGCKETTTIMCKNGVWRKQNNQCCAVPHTNYTVIPTMGRKKFTVAVLEIFREIPGFTPVRNSFSNPRQIPRTTPPPWLPKTEPVQLPSTRKFHSVEGKYVLFDYSIPIHICLL